MSTWFRDYVYIPLGGNRVKKSRWIVNLFVVWLLTGIWHGANWTFVLWGLIYFVVLLIEKQMGLTRRKLRWFSHIYTLVIVILAWVFFRSEDISSGCRYLGHMFSIGASGFVDGGFTTTIKGTYVILIFSLIGTTPIISKIFNYLKKRNLGWIESVWLFIIFSLSILEIVSSTYNPFIYFNF